MAVNFSSEVVEGDEVTGSLVGHIVDEDEEDEDDDDEAGEEQVLEETKKSR